MNTIPAEVVDETWERFADLSPEDAKGIIDELAETQPAVMAYLLASDEALADKDEKGALLCLGTVIWEVMAPHLSSDRQIPPEDLELAEEANLAFLERLGEESEIQFMDSATQMVANYNQRPLFDAILRALMEGHEDQPELAPENIGLMLVQLKTVIDCLDR